MKVEEFLCPSQEDRYGCLVFSPVVMSYQVVSQQTRVQAQKGHERERLTTT